MRRIRDELDRLQESLSEKDVRLGERERQLNALAATLEARQRELATLNDLIQREREKLQAKEAELRKQEGFVSRARDLEEALRRREASLTLRERAMRRTLEALKRQGRDLDQQRRELRRSVLRNHPAITMQALAEPATWRIPLVLAVAVLAAAAVYVVIPPMYRVQAAWERTDDGALDIEAVRKAVASAGAADGRPAAFPTTAPSARWTADGRNRRVLLEFATQDPAGAGRSLNARGQESLNVLGKGEAAGRATADEAARLAKRRGELLRELERLRAAEQPATTTTAPSAEALDAMAKRASELAATRKTVLAQLADVRSKLAEATTHPAPVAVEIPEAERSAAQADDVELAQARRRLKEQDETIRALLADAFSAAEPTLGEMRRALSELVTIAETQRQNPPDAEAASELDTIREEAAQAGDRLEAFGKGWAAARTALKQSPDVLAEQRAIEASVKEYAAASAAGLASLERRTQAIGEAGAQITKRLVVRAALMKSLRRIAEAHRELISRLGRATLDSNFRLQAAVQSAAAAVDTINARIGVIDAALRDRIVSRARQDRQRTAADLRQEEKTLAARAAELTDSLIPLQESIAAAARQWAAFVVRAAQQQEARREQDRLRDELARVGERLDALRGAAVGHAPAVRFVPASYSPRPINGMERIGWSLLAGLVVLAVGLIVASPSLMAWIWSRAAARLADRRRREPGAARLPPADARDSTPPAPGAPDGGR